MNPVDRTPVFEAEVRTWEQAIAICHKQHAAAESSEERWRIGVVITELEMNLDGAQVRLRVERARLAELAKVVPEDFATAEDMGLAPGYGPGRAVSP